MASSEHRDDYPGDISPEQEKAAAEVNEEFLVSFDEPVKHEKLFVGASVIGAGSSGEMTTRELERSPVITFEDVLRACGLHEAEVDDVHKVAQKFEYEGFDPRETCKVLRSKCSDNKTFLNDMKHFAILGVTRGTSLTKMMSEMSGKERAIVLVLKTKYDVQDSIGRGGRTAITMARILGTMPHVLAWLYHSGKGRDLGMYLPTPFRALQFPGAGAIIPKTKEFLPVLNTWRAWCNTFSAIISSPASTVDYSDIVHKRTFVPEARRLECMRKFGITVQALELLSDEKSRKMYESYNIFCPGLSQVAFLAALRSQSAFPRNR